MSDGRVFNLWVAGVLFVIAVVLTALTFAGPGTKAEKVQKVKGRWWIWLAPVAGLFFG
jgi:hypothetical protein